MEKGIIIIASTIICAFLGAYGGKAGTSKAWRRFGIPVALTILLAPSQHLFKYALCFLGMSIPLSLGYGIPDEHDEGSTLGVIFYNIFGERWCDLVLRVTLFVLTMLPVIFIADLGKWLVATFYGSLLVAPFVGDTFVKSEPEVWGLNSEDLIYYGTLGFCVSWSMIKL